MASVNTEEEALKKIFEGELRRSIVRGTTYLTSHLSTAVITVHATNISLITSWGVVTTAKVTSYVEFHRLLPQSTVVCSTFPRFTS